jgi:hypothetical protein
MVIIAKPVAIKAIIYNITIITVYVYNACRIEIIIEFTIAIHKINAIKDTEAFFCIFHYYSLKSLLIQLLDNNVSSSFIAYTSYGFELSYSISLYPYSKII